MIMQALWSRAAQTKSCRCRSCLNAATTLARRTTTAASRRRLTVNDLFTACYSTILGTAVFADAKVKEERRKEWDRAIAEAKAGMATGHGDEGFPKERKANRVEIGGNSALEQGSILRQKLIPAVWNGTTWTTPPISLTSLETKLKVLDSHIKQSLTSPPVSEDPSPPKDEAIDVDEWDEVEEKHEPLQGREPLSRVHVEKMQEMIAKLVVRLLLGTKSFSAKGGVSHIAAMADRMEELRNGRTPLPSYTLRSWEDIREERRALNRSLLGIFQKETTKKPNTDIMLAKVCYNLLISTAPPCVNTYNILINHLTNLGQPEIAQVVVDSFLHDSRFKPNQKTIRYILDLYIAKKDKVGFGAMIKRMRGVDQDMRLKRRGLYFLQLPSEQQWALSNKVIHRNGHMWQKVQRNSSIFDALICGSLELLGVRSAIRYVRAALREGFRIKSDTLNKVVRACLVTLDVEAAKKLLRALLSPGRGDLATFSTIKFNAEARHSVYQLLSLCGVQLSPQRRKSLPAGIPRDPLERFLNHTHMESINAAINRIAVTISDVYEVLGLGSLSLTPNMFPMNPTDGGNLLRSGGILTGTHEDLNRALTILDEASFTENRSIIRKARQAARNRMIPLRIIEAELGTVAERTTAMNSYLLDVTYSKLPAHRKKQYDNETRDSEETLLSNRLDLALSLHKMEQLTLPRRVLASKLGHYTEQIRSIEKEVIDTALAFQSAGTKGVVRKKTPETVRVKDPLIKRAARVKGLEVSTPKTALSKEHGEGQIGQMLARDVDPESPAGTSMLCGVPALSKVPEKPISNIGAKKPKGQLEAVEDRPVAPVVSKMLPTVKKQQGKQFSPPVTLLQSPQDKTIWLPPPTRELSAATG